MRSRLLLATTLALVTACDRLPTDAATSVSNSITATGSTSSVRWNRKAIALFRARGGNAGRVNAYLSLAQYQAALAADNAKHGQQRPSIAGAVAGASRVVLKQFYALDAASIDAEILAQRNESPFGVEHNRDFGAGQTLGEVIAAAVLASAATDN